MRNDVNKKLGIMVGGSAVLAVWLLAAGVFLSNSWFIISTVPVLVLLLWLNKKWLDSEPDKEAQNDKKEGV